MRSRLTRSYLKARTRVQAHPGLAVTLAAALAAVVMMFPAPLPGHVVSSNDLIRQIPPFNANGTAEPIRPRNTQLSDPAQVFRPDLRWARGEVRSGRLPSWDPLIFGGWPLLASQQAAPLFPVTGLSYVLPYEESIGVRIVVLLALAVLGTFLFARLIGLSAPAAGLAGLTYGLSGPLVMWSLHPQTDVHATLGWMLLGAEGALTGRRWGIPVLGAAVGCATLGGHPQSVFIDGLLVAGWVLAGLARRGSVRDRVARGSRVVAGAALGVLGGAIVLLPFLQMLGQTTVSERGGFPGPSLDALGSLAFPDIWGRPDWTFQADPAGLANYVERTAYIGVAPLLLATIGLVIGRDARRWFFAIAAALSVLLAYRVPGISAWLVAQWPLSLASMARAISILAFSLAMLAGLGLQAILAEPRALRRPHVLLVGGLLLALPLLWVVSRFQPAGGLDGALGFLPGFADPVDSGQAAAAAGVRWTVTAGVVLLVGLLLTRGRVAWALPLLLVVTLTDLAGGWHGYLPVLPTRQADLPLTASIAALKGSQGTQRTTAGAPLGGAQVLVPNTGEYFGLRDPRGRGVPVLTRTATAWATLGGAAAANFAFVDPSDPAAARALRAFAVRAVLVSHDSPPPAGARRVHRGADGDVYTLNSTLPRAWVTCDWTPTTETDAPVALSAASIATLRERPLIETASPPSTSCREPSRPVTITRDDPTHLSIDVETSDPARLVLLDTYYPGWSATIDGTRVPIQAANVAFRSVAIPAGSHEIDFDYTPTSIRAGLVLSAVAWIVIGTLAVHRRRRRSEAERA